MSPAEWGVLLVPVSIALSIAIVALGVALAKKIGGQS